MIHLHVRSCYSLLKSTLRIEDIVSKAKSLHMKAIALTDLNVMHGAMSFYHACLKENIQPIFGLECYAYLNHEKYSFVLLAKDDIGYQNLLFLSTRLSTQKEALSFD